MKHSMHQDPALYDNDNLMGAVQLKRAEMDCLTLNSNQWLELSQSNDSSTRLKAAEHLLSNNLSGRRLRRSKRVHQRLAQMLDDKDTTVINGVLLALNRVRVPVAVPKLVSMLKSGRSSLTRCLSAQGLAHQRAAGAIPALMMCVDAEETPLRLKEYCIRALGEVGNAETGVILASLYSDGLAWEVRWAIAQALMVLHDSRAKLFFQELHTDNDVPADLRKRAKTWIKRLNH